jgi:hypothetical protein
VTCIFHVAKESIDVESDGRRVPFQIFVLEGVLILEKMIVHLPEAALRTGSLGRDRRTHGEWVNVVSGEMTKHETSTKFRKALTQSFQLEVSPPAVGALELAVFDEGYMGFG